MAGAAFFAFNYPKFAMLHHIKLVFDMLQPIVLGLFLSLLVSREMPSQQRTFVTCLWAALLFALLASTTFVNAWFLLLVCLAIALLDRELRRQIFSLLRHRWLAAVTGLFLGGIGLLPLTLLYLPVFTETGAWHWFGVLKNIPQPAQLFWMGTDNLAWGWLAARWPDLDDANWSEMRIGYGAVATVVWLALVGFSAAQLTRRTPLTADHEQPRRCVGRIVAVLLVASLAIVLLGIQMDGRSPWYLVYRLLPGGAGVRSVSRYILTLSLPLAIGFAYALDKFLARPRSKVAFATVAATVVVVGVEQLATIKYMYSAYEAEQFGASIVGMVDRRCAAFYLKPTRNYGKYQFLEDHYHLTASLAALAAGVPTVNGIGAKYPPGWDLRGVFDRNIGERVENWVRRNRYNGRVCLLERDLNGSEIPVRRPLGFLHGSRGASMRYSPMRHSPICSTMFFIAARFMPCWRSVFSTFRGCMSFYRPQLMSLVGGSWRDIIPAASRRGNRVSGARKSALGHSEVVWVKTLTSHWRPHLRFRRLQTFGRADRAPSVTVRTMTITSSEGEGSGWSVRS
jgi:hypothetical protein